MTLSDVSRALGVPRARAAPSVRAGKDRPSPGSAPRLLGVGTALPALRRLQTELGVEMADLLQLEKVDRNRWDRIWKGSGVGARHAVAPISHSIGMTTAERMRLFDAHAPDLAADAARRALADACIDPRRVTDLVVVTCTGFSAPGVPRRLIDLLALDHSVRSSQIGFMGCFGGVCGLRAAAAHAAADRAAVVLLVCVELCSLHLRRDPDPQNLVASALFADGAAAVVVACGHATGPRDGATGPLPTIDPRSAPIIRPGRSLTVPGTLDAMSWIITDAGFAMTLSREVPEALRIGLPGVVGDAPVVLIHPGGPSVIDAASSALRPAQRSAVEHSRSVLRDCGNLSSASILFVLERWLRGGGRGAATLAAFGPGLTIDSVELALAATRP